MQKHKMASSFSDKGFGKINGIFPRPPVSIHGLIYKVAQLFFRIKKTGLKTIVFSAVKNGFLIDGRFSEFSGDGCHMTGGGADIGPLAPAGVVLVGFRPVTQRYFDYHHAETDTIDKVNERELELGAIAIATLAWAVADHEGTFPRNPVQEKEGR